VRLTTFRRLGVGLALGSLALAGLSPAQALAAPDGRSLAGQIVQEVESDIHVCGLSIPVGGARCHARLRTDAGVRGKVPIPSPASGPVQASANPNVLGNSGAYDPAYLRSAYNLGSLSASGGSGQTVAIVDAYDAPSAESDLAVYRSQFGLPACTTANGCFRKVNQAGAAGPYPIADSGWAQEISLDVDMVSAICPNCHILLVEANSNGFNNLGQAVNTAVALGANAISNSYGGSEFSDETSYDTSYYRHAGVAITASSGDSGYGVEYPAASQFVTAVGGTTLTQLSNGGTRNATETVWSGAGSGCSSFETKPSWQSDRGCSRRTVADVAAVADPNTGVWAYDSFGSFGQSGWLVFGGTSVASPIVASVYALAGGTGGSSFDDSFPYSHPASLFDIVSGSNGSCGSYLCTGQAGYDGPTGLGTPNGTAAFTAGSPTLQPSVSSLAPASGSTSGGTSVTISGANFSGATAVSFGSVAAASFSVSSASQITAVSPAHAAGAVDVTVTTPGGTSGTSSADTFTFAAPGPVVSGLNPTQGSTSGGTSVTISGSGFSGATAVTFGTTAASSFTVNNDSQITATSAAEAAGTVDVTVTTPAGTSATSASDRFTFAAASPSAPSVSGLNPTQGPTSGGTSVTISGSGFTGATAVAFGSSAAKSFAVNSDSQITAVSPAGAAGTVDVTVTTPAGGSAAVSADRFTYTVPAPPPSFTMSASPSSAVSVRGALNANYTVTLTASNGYNFPVKLTISGLPSNVSGTFSPATVTPSGGSTLTVRPLSTAPRGTFTLTIVGTGSDGTIQKTSVSLTIF